MSIPMFYLDIVFTSWTDLVLLSNWCLVDKVVVGYEEGYQYTSFSRRSNETDSPSTFKEITKSNQVLSALLHPRVSKV